MSDLISRKYLYDKMLEKEELARQRVLDTPTHSPAYLRYVAQLNERTALKHEIADAPTVEAVPVVHGEWILEEKAGIDYWCCSHCDKIRSEYYAKPKDNFCPNCGADMRTSAE